MQSSHFHKMFSTLVLVSLAWSAANGINVDPIARNLISKMVKSAPQYLTPNSRNMYPWTQINGTSYRNDQFGVDVKFKDGHVSSVGTIQLNGQTSTTMIGSTIYITVPISSRMVFQHDVTCLMHCTAFGTTANHDVSVVHVGTLFVEFVDVETPSGDTCSFKSYKMTLNALNEFAIASSDPHGRSEESCDYYLPHPVNNQLKNTYFKDTEEAVEKFIMALANEVFSHNNLCPQDPF